MAFEFKLPDIGEGLTEGEVVKWLVKEGDVVDDDQPMVEVMTDKATVEITAPRAGTIAKIHAAEGETVPVGSVMVVIDDGGRRPQRRRPPAPAAPAAEPRTPAPPAAPAPAPAPAPARPRPGAGPGRRRSAPRAHPGGAGHAPARARARRRPRRDPRDGRERPGDPRGRRALRRVRGRRRRCPRPAPAAAARPPGARGRPCRSAPQDERVPLRGMRGKIAEQMVRSKQFAPHFTYVDECDMTEVASLRTQAKAAAAERGVKLTFLPFIIKALVLTLKKFPVVNAWSTTRTTRTSSAATTTSASPPTPTRG